MSMTLNIGDDSDELDDDLDLDDDRDDDDDEGEGGGRSSRRTSRQAKGRQNDDEADVDDEDDEDKSPEELRAELKKARAALTRAGKQTARQRAARKELQKRIGSLEGTLDDDADDVDEGADEEGESKSKGKTEAILSARAIQKRIDRARREERAKAEDEHRRDLINTRAETALTRAGVSEKSARLLLRELDLEEIDFDPKTRSVDGLEEEIDRLKDEFPDLFRSKAGRRRINGGDERDGRGSKRRPLTATERQAAQLRGR